MKATVKARVKMRAMLRRKYKARYLKLKPRVFKTVAKEINTGIRGKNDYDLVSKYSNAEEALKAFASEEFWRKGNKKETRDGDKQFYKCKFIKSIGCSAKCFLLYHNDEDGVSHYKI
jgi:hypothetical protein